MILDAIVQKKKIRIGEGKKAMPLSEMRKMAESSAGTVSFRRAITAPGLSVIAEVKKASPSKGLICSDFKPLRIAAQYEGAGAAAVSVLTEEDFFLGCGETLTRVKSLVKLPVLRKDFIVDVWQVYESRAIDADAVLLIATLLDSARLREFRLLAEELGMDALVEAHSEPELESAVASGAGIIGINNRDLNTFFVDIRTTGHLKKLMPSGITVVSESGIENRRDIEYLEDIGVEAALVGEALMKAPDIAAKMRELKGGETL